MNIEDSQKDMRLAYLGGAAGVLISGIVWITAGIVAVYFSAFTSITVFFFGGMLIHPGSILIDKLMNRVGKHQEDNPLGKLAMESTVLLFVGLFMAYSVFQIKPTWFYPIMLMIIGSRYLVFQSIYGLKLYWALGMILVGAGMICLISNQVFYVPALIGGIVEVVLGVWIFQSEKNKSN